MLYIGLDTHSKDSTYDAIDPATGEMTSGYRVANDEIVERIRLLPGKKLVILEAGRTSWDWYHRLIVVADEVWIVDPKKVREMLQGQAKTDRRDARALAMLAIEGRLTPLWVPDAACMQLRSLTRGRGRLIKQSTASKNALRGLAAQYGRPCEYSSVTGVAAQKFFDQLELPGVAKDVLGMNRELIKYLDEKVREMEIQIVELLNENPIWILLQTIPGVAKIISATFVAEIGTIKRFESPDSLTRYSGLDPFTKGSGNNLKHGPLQKRGNPYLRTAAVLAAQQQRFTKNKSRLNRNYWRMVPESSACKRRQDRYCQARAQGCLLRLDERGALSRSNIRMITTNLFKNLVRFPCKEPPLAKVSKQFPEQRFGRLSSPSLIA